MIIQELKKNAISLGKHFFSGFILTVSMSRLSKDARGVYTQFLNRYARFHFHSPHEKIS